MARIMAPKVVMKRLSRVIPWNRNARYIAYSAVLRTAKKKYRGNRSLPNFT